MLTVAQNIIAPPVVIADLIRNPVLAWHWIPDQDAMDASLPTGKELRPLNAKDMNGRLSGREISSNRGGSSDGYGIKVPRA